MAYPSDNGDISQIKHLGKISLPGAGRNLAGQVKQKVLVWGELTGKWADTSGLILSERGGPAALGLGAIDFISFEVKTVAATAQADEACYQAAYDTGLDGIKLHLEGTNPAAAAACVLGYVAVGDDATAPEFN